MCTAAILTILGGACAWVYNDANTRALQSARLEFSDRVQKAELDVREERDRADKVERDLKTLQLENIAVKASAKADVEQAQQESAKAQLELQTVEKLLSARAKCAPIEDQVKRTQAELERPRPKVVVIDGKPAGIDYGFERAQANHRETVQALAVCLRAVE